MWFWNIFRLINEVFLTDETLFQFCVNTRLISDFKQCPKCRNPEGTMPIFKDASTGFFGTFKCQKKSQHRDRKDYVIAVASGKWFNQCKLDVKKCILLTYCFAREFTYEQTKM